MEVARGSGQLDQVATTCPGQDTATVRVITPDGKQVPGFLVRFMVL